MLCGVVFTVLRMCPCASESQNCGLELQTKRLPKHTYTQTTTNNQSSLVDSTRHSTLQAVPARMGSSRCSRRCGWAHRRARENLEDLMLSMLFTASRTTRRTRCSSAANVSVLRAVVEHWVRVSVDMTCVSGTSRSGRALGSGREPTSLRRVAQEALFVFSQ